MVLMLDVRSDYLKTQNDKPGFVMAEIYEPGFGALHAEGDREGNIVPASATKFRYVREGLKVLEVGGLPVYQIPGFAMA